MKKMHFSWVLSAFKMPLKCCSCENSWWTSVCVPD